MYIMYRCVCIYIYMYIYIYRERERERESRHPQNQESQVKKRNLTFFWGGSNPLEQESG